MNRRGEAPLRAAVQTALACWRFAAAAEALAEVLSASRSVSLDRTGLTSDEADALAQGWELQAADDFRRGRFEAGLEDLAIAEDILDGWPEHNEHRGWICAQIASRIRPATAGLRSVKEEYLATAVSVLTGTGNAPIHW